MLVLDVMGQSLGSLQVYSSTPTKKSEFEEHPSRQQATKLSKSISSSLVSLWARVQDLSQKPCKKSFMQTDCPSLVLGHFFWLL